MIAQKNKIFFLLISILLFVSGCNKDREMNLADYFKYVNSSENELISSRTLNGIVYTLKFEMPEQICFEENQNDSLSGDKFQFLLKSYTGRLRASLIIQDEKERSISVKNAIYNKEVYSNLVAYANTQLNKDIYIFNDNKKTSCDISHLEPASSGQPILRIACAFHNIESAYSNGFDFVFDDNIFNNGPIKFSFSKDIFENFPKLKLE